MKFIKIIFVLYFSWCADIKPASKCSNLLDWLLTTTDTENLSQLLVGKAFQKYSGDAELRPLVEQISNLQNIKITQPLTLIGKSEENGDALKLTISFIGPKRGSKLPPPSATDMFATLAGYPTPFVSESQMNNRLIRAIIAIAEGIDLRLQQNPTIKRISIITPEVANLKLRSLLQYKLGFKLLSHKTTLIGTGLSNLELNLEAKNY